MKEKLDLKNEISISNGEMTVSEKALHYIRYAGRITEYIETAKAELEDIRAAFQQAMEENGIKQFKNDDVTISYVAGTTRKTVDTARLKEDGLYDQYTKETTSGPSVRFKFSRKPKDEDLPF
jgi:hypothetical protein